MKKLSRNSNTNFFDGILMSRFMLAAMVAGIVFAASLQTFAQAQCDVVAAQVMTRVSGQVSDAKSGAFGYSRYDILRSGETDHYIHIFYDAPDDTVFKAYFNGEELATLTRYPTSNFGEYWFWEGFGKPHPVGHVGDLITITKNGEPFLGAKYSRETPDYDAADASVSNGASAPCTVYRGMAYLPISSQPRALRSAFMWAATPQTDPPTKITVNEPGIFPGELGAEIASLPLGGTNNYSNGWSITRIVATNTPLTETQFTMLRQGLLTVTTFTAAHPDGYSTITIHTQGINTGSDFEGDGKADLTIFRPSDAAWFMKLSSSDQIESVVFGNENDHVVIGDYDYDRKADIATFQPETGEWRIFRSSNGVIQTVSWGVSNDIPMAMETDPNNGTDLAVFRPSNGIWYIKRMGDIIKPVAKNVAVKDRKNKIETIEVDSPPVPEGEDPEYLTFQWGVGDDRPLVADFDNDGIDEVVVFRPSEGNWYIYNFKKNIFQILHWGLNGDIPMARDFDGDRKADLAVFRPSEGNWYIYGSLEGRYMAYHHGLNGDIPVPADFDRDGVADIAVFRPRTGVWYINGSSNDSYSITKFGSNGDIPAVTPR